MPLTRSQTPSNSQSSWCQPNETTNNENYSLDEDFEKEESGLQYLKTFLLSKKSATVAGISSFIVHFDFV
jgi:hypothetical protein